MRRILLTGGYIVPMTREPFYGDILIEGKFIKGIDKRIEVKNAERKDCTGKVIMPGLIQTHIHLAQVLFRGLAEDLKLLDWLSKRIYILESAHTPESMYWSAMLGIVEMVKFGTTAIIDIGCARYADSLLLAMRDSGIRGYSAMMLLDAPDVPAGLRGDKDKIIADAIELVVKFHKTEDGRLGVLFAPRFSLACSDDLIKLLPELAKKYDTILQTHAAETQEENDFTLKTKGYTNIEYLDKMGFLTDRTSLVHTIWVSENEMRIIKERGCSIVTCPSTNLKLASGIAPIEEFRNMGIKIGIGADGAPCNNTLDPFAELKLAALLQKVKYGPSALPAYEALKFATLNGAEILRMPVGGIELDKEADLTILSIDNKPHTNPKVGVDIYTRLIYEAKGSDVTDVFVAGQELLVDGKITFIDEQKVIEHANAELRKILENVSL